MRNNNKKIDYRRIKSRRYHYQTYFPENLSDMIVNFFSNFDTLGATHHAKEEMSSDKLGAIPMPTKEDILNHENIVIEIYEPIIDGVASGYIQKLLIRVKNLSDRLDYSYLIAREGFIVSTWANMKNDIHRLTNSNGYYIPKEKTEKERV